MRDYFSLVTFSHTVFAMPFALLGYTLGVLSPAGAFSWTDLVLVVACMVFARNAAMAFNRLVDAEIDARNARTAVRDIPSGKISKQRARWFVAVNAVLFSLCALALNTLCFALSPVALGVILGYSFTKRFTWLCHAILGVGLALAPIGAYLAVTGQFSPVAVVLGLVVLLWVAGFDIVYALQDREFDESARLNSVPTRFGESRSLMLSRAIHVACAATLLALSVLLYELYPNALIFIALSASVFVAALLYQQSIVRVSDLSNIDRAFFTTNGMASVAYALVLAPGLLYAAGVFT